MLGGARLGRIESGLGGDLRSDGLAVCSSAPCRGPYLKPFLNVCIQHRLYRKTKTTCPNYPPPAASRSAYENYSFLIAGLPLTFPLAKANFSRGLRKRSREC